MAQKYDVFLSHTGADKSWTRRLVDAILSDRSGRQLSVFFDERNIEPGASIPREVAVANQASAHLAVVLSPEGSVAPWVLGEVDMMTYRDPGAQEGRVVPLLLRQCAIPAGLRHLKHIDFRDPDQFDEALAKLVTHLRRNDPVEGTLAASGDGLIPTDLGEPYAWASDDRERNFVGRHDQLALWRRFIADLTAERTPPAADGVRLVWVHGFGGMGKTWLLHQFADLAAAGGLRVGVVDWQPPEGHRPAGTPPRDVLQFLLAIAYRIAHLYSAELLTPFWTAVQEVVAAHDAREAHRSSLRDTLHALAALGPKRALDGLSTPNATGQVSDVSRRVGVLAELLRVRREWTDDPQLLERRVSAHVNDLAFERHDRDLLTDWIIRKTPNAQRALAAPGAYLTERLREVVEEAVEIAPLVLILDTCEILFDSIEAEFDEWLRMLLVPLIRGGARLLTCIGSRFAPDRTRPEGSRFGWRNEVSSTRRHVVDASRDPLTYGDIVTILRTHAEAHPLPGRSVEEAAERLLAFTEGIPLAVGVALALHRDGSDVLSTIGGAAQPDAQQSTGREVDVQEDDGEDDDDEDDDRERGSDRVLADVTARLLWHLDRQDRQDDLRDLIALALLKQKRRAVLEKLWHTDRAGAQARLAELGARYDLMAGNDLHPRVRRLLRRRWRKVPHQRVRPVAEVLEGAVATSQPAGAVADARVAEWIVERVNVASWHAEDRAYDELVRAYVLFLAHELSTDDLDEIAAMCRPVGGIAREAAGFLARAARYRWGAPVLSGPDIAWLKRRSAQAWSPVESAALELLAGFSFAAAKQFRDAVEAFESAFAGFGLDLPLRTEVAPVYFEAVHALGQAKQLEAATAVGWARKLGIEPAGTWHQGYYWVLHNAKYYADAERYCRRVLSLDPDSTGVRAYLSHILDVHLGRGREAEELLRDELVRQPDEVNAHYFLAQVLARNPDKRAEALDHYRSALAKVITPEEAGRVRTLVLETLLALPGRDTEVEGELAQLERFAITGSVRNGIAWKLYVKNTRLEIALRYARSAHVDEPNDVNITHTLAAVLVRASTWGEAQPIVREWIERTDVARIIHQWHDYVLLFQDVFRSGVAPALALLLSPRGSERVFAALKLALTMASGTDSLIGGDEPSVEMLAAKLVPQIKGHGPHPWPEPVAVGGAGGAGAPDDNE